MKSVICIFFALIIFQICFADVTHNAQNRIEELEKKLNSTKKELSKFQKNKQSQQKVTSKIENEIRYLKNQINNLKNQKKAKNSELNEIYSQIISSETNISLNENLIQNIVKNLNEIYFRKKYLHSNPIFNSNLQNLKITAKLVLRNLDSLSETCSKQKIETKKTENKIQKLTTKLTRNQQNCNQNIRQKEVEEKNLEKIVNIEKSCKKRINEFQKGIISLQEFIAQIEAEKQGRIYSFKFTNGLVWPVSGTVLKNQNSDGIVIQSKIGTDVKAAAAGIVAFSGWFENRGNLVIIDHQNGFYSLYGFNDKLLVNKGQKVVQGEIIAHSGNNPLLEKDCLSFELRKSGKPVNPLDYLK